MNMALISLLSVIFLFFVGAFRKNPIHIGVLGLLISFVIGKIAGIADVAIMKFFPTTLFVRVFGIMLFFGIPQANGSLELLAKKLLSKTGTNTKLLPFYIFYVGILMGAIGINSLAGMAILSGIGISLALASGGNPLLFGIAGGYGIAAGCYSPINEFTANIVSASDGIGHNASLMQIFIISLIAFSISFLVMYLLLGGYKAKGTLKESIISELPNFNKSQLISLYGIVAVLVLVIFFKIDIGWSGLLVASFCMIFGVCNSTEAIKNVSLPSLILISGVGTLINVASELGGFELMSSGLMRIMTTNTVPAVMSLTTSAMSMFSIARLTVITLVPTLSGIINSIGSSMDLAVIGVSLGAFASSVGPLSANGALIVQNLSQQLGEEKAARFFTKQMIMGVVGAFVIAFTLFIITVLNIF